MKTYRRNKTNKKLNSAQIAEMAGVSRSTVSRVINDYDNVPKATHDKVMEVIRENNYYPHLSGQLLVGKKSGTLGFFWVKEKGYKIANDDLASSYFVNIIEAAARENYLMLTCILDNLTSAENKDWVTKIFMQGRIDAGIFIGTSNNEPLIEQLIANGQIVGIFDHYHPNRNEPNRISVNYETAVGSKMIEHLHALGHRKIALIHGDETRYSSMERRENFIAAMNALNLPIEPAWICNAGIYEGKAYSKIKKMLTKAQKTIGLPTAICANNDATAFAVYKVLNEMQIKIPSQISVTGIDGNTRKVDPPLTTYSFNYYEIFRSLVRRTIAAIEQQPTNPTTEFFKGTLTKGKSVAKI
ncbi:MAG: LacI family transcriptional regulator [Turicibacter sp.]|nr:LacI family transcriptional regulator [Turicibacter sp.]